MAFKRKVETDLFDKRDSDTEFLIIQFLISMSKVYCTNVMPIELGETNQILAAWHVVLNKKPTLAQYMAKRAIK